MSKNHRAEVTISTYELDGLYFAVGVSKEGNIIKCSLPKESKQNAINEIKKTCSSFKISNKYQKYAKNVCKSYYGEKIHFNIDIPDMGDFQKEVLQEVSKIPYGEVRTYKQIAEAINSKAYRAVGTAISKNPLPLIIPCHRVVKSDLSVGDFFGGMEMKKEILKNEGICIVKGKIKKKVD
ncbi:MAG: MGMT family protein [Methanobacterium sp.]|uniref:MGMT family protein n=1 Tax=Methanobacterium sp. TaxID=2164 RepID=UPI003D6619AA|nr:MGMT family protein [Methanobacterium sp.]